MESCGRMSIAHSRQPLLTLLLVLQLTTLVATAPAAVVAAAGAGAAAGRLRANYYARTCPNVGKIVADEVAKAFYNDPAAAPALLRLHFHDCFVQGCDASVLLNSPRGAKGAGKAEKDAPPNFSLMAFEVVDAIKRRLEQACPAIVSCADLLALAARESVRLTGGPWIPARLGRRDGKTSVAMKAESVLPAATLNTSGLIANFAKVGLNLVDVVALSGAHTIGRGHCKSVANRLRPNYDPTMSRKLRSQLTMVCYRGAPRLDPMAMFASDLQTPVTFDNQYYKNILAGNGAFTSDQALLYDRRSKPYVRLYAQNQKAFFNQFRLSMLKMGNIRTLTGAQGEIRRVCSRVNGVTTVPK